MDRPIQPPPSTGPGAAGTLSQRLLAVPSWKTRLLCAKRHGIVAQRWSEAEPWVGRTISIRAASRRLDEVTVLSSAERDLSREVAAQFEPSPIIGPRSRENLLGIRRTGDDGHIAQRRRTAPFLLKDSPPRPTLKHLLAPPRKRAEPPIRTVRKRPVGPSPRAGVASRPLYYAS